MISNFALMAGLAALKIHLLLLYNATPLINPQTLKGVIQQLYAKFYHYPVGKIAEKSSL